MNKIRNADFSLGARLPRNWTWDAGGARWRRPTGSTPADRGGVVIEVAPAGSARWSQTVVCKRDEFYRIEARVTCDLEAAGEAGGVTLSVQPVVDARAVGEPRVTPGVVRSGAPLAVRAVYRTPEDVNRLRITVGVTDAAGWARVHEVVCFSIIEPEWASHPLAVPPPAYALKAPRVASGVAVCSSSADARPITSLLRSHFGNRAVPAIAPSRLSRSAIRTDAILLPDPTPPPSIRSVGGLVKLASDRTVVISLTAFAKLAGSDLSLRRVEQPDDPICARIAYSNFATRGFALHDQFPFAGVGRTPTSFAQNHFRRTGAMKAFCKKHGCITLLESMCNQDLTSERPVALYKETPGGGLYVIDVEPAEAPLSNQAESTLAVQLLLSILGHTSPGMGQYTAPVRGEAEFREQIREMAPRFPHFVVHDADVPVDEVSEQFVTIGREDESFGLPLTPKPLVLVRTGIASGDAESVYGAWLWFKQLLRPAPYTCPYATPLASRYRLAWIPSAAPWEPRDGWRRTARPPGAAMALECDGAPIAALIDIVSRPIDQPRVIVPRANADYDHLAAWLPRLLETFGSSESFAPLPPDGSASGDQDGVTWQRVRYTARVIVDGERFRDPIHDDVRGAGGHATIIEVPGFDANFTAHSIHRTSLTATLLEMVVGLRYGLIAVNRRATAVGFDGFPPIAPGKSLILDARDPLLNIDAANVG